ncbi:rab-like GTPase activating protein, putative [Trypanosoma cruzi]|nr:rab-like GTPase activating protein, putative [Trypanosoma cruzi]KAF8288351.1 putative rab-like GTPase activating protein [Trypanosoma cruzi]PWU97710.1 putative rab-like GTPase activating protein [Trypanosoma cruzi]RNF16188.1 putative rab-like GTPase activating protein [Trypanosoma cruzi]
MAERLSRPHASALPRPASSSMGGELTDRYGFFIDAERKAEEGEYIRQHPEMPATQKMWARVLVRWDHTPYKKKKKLAREGIPQSMRRIVWPLLLNSHESSSLSHEKYHVLKSRPPADPEVFAVIERDLGRTFSAHQWFARADGVGQTKLRGILRAYANIHPEVGYVQGMAFLASTLLLHIEDEEDTFWAFFSLMRHPKYSIWKMFTPGFPALYMRFYQLKKLMQRNCMSLFRLLEAFHVEPEVYATHWFLTLFSYCLDFDLLSRIWDMFLCEGWKIIFRVAIALFLLCEKTLKEAKDECNLLLALRRIHMEDTELILRRSLKVKFKTADLLRWEAKFEARK